MFRAGLGASRGVRPRCLPHTPHVRAFNSSAETTHGFLKKRTAARITALTAGAAVLLSTSTVYAYSSDDQDLSIRPSLPSLVRAYAVYSMCSFPSLVDASPKILSALSAIPGLKQITEAFVRVTFFDQFVGADTAEETIPLLHSLRNANKGALFAYSVEVDENEATGASISPPSATDTPGSPSHSPAADADANVALPHKRIVDEMLHCIDVAADFEASLAAPTHTTPAGDVASGLGRRTWVAVKFTALLPDAHALIALSSLITASKNALPHSSPEKAVAFPGTASVKELDLILQPTDNDSDVTLKLTPAEIHSIRDLYADLARICTRARERGVKVIIDAEYSWYQPAIDALTLALMREFNSLKAQAEEQVQPLIYGTYQAYLRRTPAQLALALEDARKNNYALGVKLVRGAYHPHEIAAHNARHNTDSSRRPSLSISPDAEPPVWMEKKDTDASYNGCVRLLLAAVKADVDRCSRPHTDGSKLSTVIQSQSNGLWASLSGLLGWRNDSTQQISSTRPTTEVKPAPGIGILFGTHNWDSCALILKELLRNGLAVEDTASPLISEDVKPVKVGPETVDRIAVGQLYGMSDELTDWVASRISCSTPFVIKYVPYGALAEVMPYLSRRAIENKSMLNDGAAIHERQRAALEIRKRIFG